MNKKKIRVISYLLIGNILLSPISILALTKTETIYSNLKENGEPTKTQVISKIKNNQEEELEDETELKELLNIQGKETYTLDGTSLKWQALGKDISYEGKTDKTLPMKTNIKYYLNEEELSYQEVKGKEGRIKVELNFENEEEHQVYVNGKQETVRMPFVVTIGTILSNKENKNISITNGKVVDTGTRNILIGLATPGLYESLGFEELKEGNKITVSFDTTNFSLPNIYIVATPKLIEEKDFQIFDEMTTLNNSMQELQKGVNRLEEGATQLQEGATTLNVGQKELQEGIKQISLVLEQMETGSLQLQEGTKKLNNTLTLLIQMLDAKDFPNKVLSLQTLKNTNEQIMQGLILQSGKSTLENLQQYYVGNNLKEYQGQDNDKEKMLAKVCMEQYMLLSKNNEALTITITSLQELGSKLQDMKAYINQVSQLEQGTTTLSNGLHDLKTGVDKLYQGATRLVNGTTSLEQGTITLKDGIHSLNETGIHKLTGYVSTMKNYSDKGKALVELSKNYKGFASNNSTNTTFISLVKETK